MTQLELFAGIGGFGLAGHWAGIETIAQVEIDDFCQKVLQKNFPNAAKYRDIKEFDGTKYRGAVDIVSGGFPCQPYSTAGKRLGKEDERHLWPEMLRVIREVQPNWVVGENVGGILNQGDKSTLGRIKSELEACGYGVQCFDIPGYVYGLQTMERHIWIVAKAIGVGFKRSKKKHNGINGNKREFQGNDTRFNNRWNICDSKFCRVSERVSARLDKHQRHRLHALGNSIVPHVAYHIFKAIIECENL